MSNTYNTPYVKWLIKQLENRTDAKTIALLRRGFIVDSKGKLEPGCPGEDQAAFKRTEKMSFDQVLLLPSWRGMSSSIGNEHLRKTIDRFANTVFGSKVPTKDLDCGVAPIVKRAANLGLMTEFCCDGHGKKAPYITFPTGWDMGLFLEVMGFTEIRSLSGDVHLKVDQEHNSISFFSSESPDAYREQDMVPVCEALFQIGMAISTPQIRAKATDAKKRIIHEARGGMKLAG